MVQAYRNIDDIEKAFPDPDSCIVHLERIRWNGQITSPYTGGKRISRKTIHVYLCKETNREFTVLTGTIFAHTKMPLQHWFKVIWQFAVDPEISTLRAARRMGINQKTVWNMKRKIDSMLTNKG